MTDLATLGLAVDSGPVKSATSDLREFSAAAKGAQSSADGFSKAASGGVAPQQQYGKSVNTVVKQLEMQEARLRLTGREFAVYQNLVRAGVTIQSEAGQKIAAATRSLYDMEQSQKQLRAANDNSSSSLDRFTSRFTRGLIAGAAIAAVQQLTRYLFELNAQLAATADTAQRVGIGGQQFQGLQTAAGYKGIGGNDFSAAMISFNQQIDLAKHGLGDLKVLLTANGKMVGDTATTLVTVADLVQRASGDYARQVSILQQAGLPATQQWVRLFEQGGGAIEKIAASSTKLSNQQLEEAKKLNDKWNELWTNFENWGKRAAVNTAAAFRDLTFSPFDSVGRSLLKQGQGNRLTQDQANSFYGAVGFPGPARVEVTGGRQAAPFDPNLAKQQIALEQQRLGLLGPLVTAEEARRQVELQIQTAGLNNIGIDSRRAETLKRLAYETNLGVTSIKASTDALNVEAQTIGMSTGQAAAYSAAQTILNEKKRLGIAVSDEQRAAIMREAEALGRAKDNVEQLRFAHDTFQSTFVEFGQQLRNGASAWDAFKNAGVNALGKIADKLMQMAADNLWKSAFGGTSGSFLGGLGSLFGLGGSAGSVGVVGAAGGMVVPTFFHGGGVVGYGGYQRGAFPMSLFERAPRYHLGVDEVPAILQRGERVIPRGQNDNRSGSTVNVSMPISVNASGSDPSEITKAVRGYVNSPDFDAKVASAVIGARKRNVKI